MLSDKEQKKEFKKLVSKTPEKYFAVNYLKKEGFKRSQCNNCKKFFWSINSNFCGDPACSGGFRFIGKNITKNKLDYTEVWKEFSNMFKKLKYTPIKRYPVVSRWNPTTDFTIASISAFQPFVVSGEVKPPANPLVLPQFCLRFGDVDNVGITGSHMTGFVMIGQHAFVEKKDWNQDKYLSDIHLWIKSGLGLKNEEVIFHEDAWAGGGNFGPCMEFFSYGVELGNQVYMMYEQTQNGNKELPIKVLDMGMGQERNAWFSQGSATIYDATFPDVMKNLYDKTGIKTDKELMAKFIPQAGNLNVDETEDLDRAWKSIAKNVSLDINKLKEKILPLSGLYSIGEHTRALLFALNDGALPSNVGGGYNLRILARRCFSFNEKYNWKLNLPEICELHSKELKKQYPELSENLNDVKKLLDVEKNKYEINQQKAKQIVQKIVIEKRQVTQDKLIQLYDSDGISPYVIKDDLNKVNVEVKVPDNFYALVSSRHEFKEQEHATKKEDVLDLDGLKETETLYYKDYKLDNFSGKVLRVIGNKVILDKTVFYPTSGGQLHDTGTLNNFKVIDVFKQGKVIVHVLEDNHKLKVNDKVNGKIDIDRRIQLAQHHTSTHIVNAAARIVLGNHVNQAGAKKTTEKAHIDITHYQNLTEGELKKIEDEANKIIKKNIAVNKSFMPREDAEKKYGFTIYQGGVPIGKELRIVDIKGIDVECCGGTHLDNTKEAVKIKILKSSKISDSIVRIEFVAGKKALEEESKEKEILNELSKLLNCNNKQIPSRLEELFNIWKDIVKKGKKIKYELKSREEFNGDLTAKSVEILKTQSEYLVSTVNRFLKEINDKK